MIPYEETPLFGYDINMIIEYLAKLNKNNRITYLNNVIKKIGSELLNGIAISTISKYREELNYLMEPKPEFIERNARYNTLCLNIILDKIERKTFQKAVPPFDWIDFLIMGYDTHSNAATQFEYITDLSIIKLNQILDETGLAHSKIFNHSKIHWYYSVNSYRVLMKEIGELFHSYSFDPNNFVSLFEDENTLGEMKKNELPFIIYTLVMLENISAIKGDIRKVMYKRILLKTKDEEERERNKKNIDDNYLRMKNGIRTQDRFQKINLIIQKIQEQKNV